MAEENQKALENTIDVFYDMDINQICQHFSKSRNTVDKAVAKLVREYPDKNYKYKNPETKRITITAEGVEKLSAYFRKEKKEVVSAEQTELKYENEKLKALLEEKEKTIVRMDALYAQKLQLEIEKSQQTLLLESHEQKMKMESLESENQNLEAENHNLEDQNKSLESENKKLLEQLDEFKQKEEEYNSKSFFYRLTHKFSL